MKKKQIKKIKKNICPSCGDPMDELPASRDYTDKCSKCFAKSFVNSIFK